MQRCHCIRSNNSIIVISQRFPRGMEMAADFTVNFYFSPVCPLSGPKDELLGDIRQIELKMRRSGECFFWSSSFRFLSLPSSLHSAKERHWRSLFFFPFSESEKESEPPAIIMYWQHGSYFYFVALGKSFVTKGFACLSDNNDNITSFRARNLLRWERRLRGTRPGGQMY